MNEIVRPKPLVMSDCMRLMDLDGEFSVICLLCPEWHNWSTDPKDLDALLETFGVHWREEHPQHWCESFEMYRRFWGARGLRPPDEIPTRPVSAAPRPN